MATRCASYVRGRVLRVTRLDACGRVVTDAFGDVVGYTMDTAVSSDDSAFALEVWAGSPSTTGCADGAAGNFGYVLLPFLQGGVVGDFTIENAEVTFTISNASTKDGNAWGVGPYDVVLGADSMPTTLPEPLTTTEHLYFSQTGVAPPEAECGARPLLDPAADALTSVTDTPTGLSTVFAPTPASTDPWWVDFGDGLWDYAAGGGNITHIYHAAGSYDWIAYRNASTVTGTVVVAGAGITSITPVSGPIAGGTATTVNGFGFTGATAVNFGATPGTSFTVVSDTVITVTTPAHAAGAVTVTVVKAAGNGVLTNGFTFV